MKNRNHVYLLLKTGDKDFEDKTTVFTLNVQEIYY